jgi:hypothetical protein
MTRMILCLTFASVIAAVLLSERQTVPKLSAPTYFIAAKAEYRDSEKIWLRGTSNLPSGAILIVDVQNYVGENSKVLSRRSLPRVGRDGFFEATLVPLPETQFRQNIVCIVSFSPNYPDQDAPVVKAVGKKGEQLGFPTNPQTEINSGERVSLRADVHVD